VCPCSGLRRDHDAAGIAGFDGILARANVRRDHRRPPRPRVNGGGRNGPSSYLRIPVRASPRSLAANVCDTVAQPGT
jgi:hypothetical protein